MLRIGKKNVTQVTQCFLPVARLRPTICSIVICKYVYHVSFLNDVQCREMWSRAKASEQQQKGASLTKLQNYFQHDHHQAESYAQATYAIIRTRAHVPKHTHTQRQIEKRRHTRVKNKQTNKKREAPPNFAPMLFSLVSLPFLICCFCLCLSHFESSLRAFVSLPFREPKALMKGTDNQKKSKNTTPRVQRMMEGGHCLARGLDKTTA